MNDLTPDEAQVIQRMRQEVAARADRQPAEVPEHRLALRLVRTPVAAYGEHEAAVNEILEPLVGRGRIAQPPRVDIVEGHLITAIWIVDPV